ncbi:LCP family glycopolymer transferase CpsA [Streptococcus fryi]
MPRRSNHYKKHEKNKLDFLNIALITLSFVVGLFLIFAIYSYNLLQFNQLDKVVMIGIVVALLIALLLVIFRKLKWLTTLFLVLFLTVGLSSLYVIKTFIDVSQKMNTTAQFSELEMSVVVPVDSDIASISDIDEVLAPVGVDNDNITALIDDIASKKGKQLTVIEQDSYAKAYDVLSTDKNKAMVLNGAYASLLGPDSSDYAEKLKKIYTFRLKKEVKVSTSKPKTNAKAMTVYISGIDTYGPISTISRSDVNILMTINRETGKILLTTTPRDSYVSIAGGGQGQKDKLTHAGIYGVESSIQTLENLYDIPIDYYAKINFTSFLNLIDLLGGIEVENDQEFTSLHGNYHFPVGMIHLDSKKALGFVRERYSLEHGDNDRGQNQMKVIAAIIKKLTSVNAIANYQQLIDGLGDSVQTSMPLVTIMALANEQLASHQEYTITSQSLEGTGSTGELPSYAMPGAALYMLSIDENSLNQVSANIKATLEGR